MSQYTDSNGLICMIRCMECDRENWGPAVATGQCAWCGFNPNETEEVLLDEEKRIIG
jgi:ribosomal protein L37E